MKIINILGIKITQEEKKEILAKIKNYILGSDQHYIVTPNPEIILKAGHNEELFYILNQADLALPDGTGLKLAALIMGKNLHRITGADLIHDVLSLAQEKNIKIAVANWQKGLSSGKEIKKSILKLWPRLNLIVEDMDREWIMPYYKNINIFQPQIVFVNFGSPWQEKFLYHQLPKMPYVKLGMAVGGSFDFLTKKIKRAPKFMRLFGLEWLWRFIKQPHRWKRIYKATIVFSWNFFRWRFIMPHFYRPNVVCLLYKKENDKFYILLLKRQDEKEHWQLPQGGTDGEKIETAGIRELSEEINCSKFKPKIVFKNLWKYQFNKTNKTFKKQRHNGYKGQKQSLFIAEFYGQDKEIKINFWDHNAWKWVEEKELIKKVHPIRQQATKIFLEKFKIYYNKHIS